MNRSGLPHDVVYPCSDGQPMAETDIHATCMESERAREETAEARQQQAEARRSAEARVEREIAARQAAEARTAELEARLRDLEGAATASQAPGT